MVTQFIYQKPILCTFHIAVEFLFVPYKGLYGWGGGSAYVKFLYVLATAREEWGKSKCIKLLYILAEHSTEYRIQKVMYIKLSRYLFFVWRLDLMMLMRANALLGPLKGVGPCNGCCPHQNHYVPRHKNNNRYISSYYVFVGRKNSKQN